MQVSKIYNFFVIHELKQKKPNIILCIKTYTYAKMYQTFLLIKVNVTYTYSLSTNL